MANGLEMTSFTEWVAAKPIALNDIAPPHGPYKSAYIERFNHIDRYGACCLRDQGHRAGQHITEDRLHAYDALLGTLQSRSCPGPSRSPMPSTW